MKSTAPPALVGYTGGAWGEVMLKIVDVYPGDAAANGVAIAEIKVSAGSIEEFRLAVSRQPSASSNLRRSSQGNIRREADR